MVTFNALVQIFGRFFQEGGSAILKEMIEYTETKYVTEDGDCIGDSIGACSRRIGDSIGVLTQL